MPLYAPLYTLSTPLLSPTTSTNPPPSPVVLPVPLLTSGAVEKHGKPAALECLPQERLRTPLVRGPAPEGRVRRHHQDRVGHRAGTRAATGLQKKTKNKQGHDNNKGSGRLVESTSIYMVVRKFHTHSTRKEKEENKAREARRRYANRERERKKTKGKWVLGAGCAEGSRAEGRCGGRLENQNARLLRPVGE